MSKSIDNPDLAKKRIKGTSNLENIIKLDYPINSIPRYGYGKPPHPKLHELINRNRNEYKEILEKFLEFKKYFLEIPLNNKLNEASWINGLFSGFDAVSLYSLVSINKPRKYIEIGSGVSTRFVAKAKLDQQLSTEIISIDLEPRKDIDTLCDIVIRSSLEEVDLNIFSELGSNDILFIDGSHRCFTNSDVAISFLDILPILNPGTLIHFHDIYLPNDYPPEWKGRYYSEQYLLASYILAEGNKFKSILPNSFISLDPELNQILSPIWNSPTMDEVASNGCSYWIKII